MLPVIPGYRLEQEIHSSARTTVYRGVREPDGRRVIIKTINKAYPDPHDILRLKREHRILGTLRFPGVITVEDLVPWENNLALVLEDCGGQSLANVLGAREGLPLDTFFKIASQCARVLTAIHAHVIHKDLNPRNLLWNPETEELRFIDFGLSSEITRERQSLDATRRMVGSFPYMSPEQTGRMNRDLDFRTDFYSLGITFYVLLTGQLPFMASDPMEWIYCHTTKIPTPPEQLNPQIPEALGRLVMKLMAKNPEDRYQSAQGLLWDLEECRRQWSEARRIELFELARHDVMAQFQVPQKLYGREAELEVLQAAYRKALSCNSTLAMVTGQAGIGKSALVNEVLASIVDRKGYFLEGKFDQFQRHVPYAAVSQALGGLVEQVLAEPEERLSQWKARLVSALGPNGRIALDLVPQLEKIVGPQPAIVELNPTEEQNRFLSTIKSLFSVLARPEHPIVLFLDDLQWCDAPTLTLLQSLLEARQDQALMVIGAYRDNEVHEGHPLMLTLAEIEKGQPIERLNLGRLSLDTINQIVADALHVDPDRTLPLSGLLYRKTEGNPFFAGEVLRTLHQDGLLRFDHAEGRWSWDLDGIKRARISDNIVDFLLDRVQRLGAETQAQLRLAAAIGNAFDLGLLAKIQGRSAASVANALWPALAEGLIVPLSDEYRLLHGLEDEDQGAVDVSCQFAHDRIRQAAYGLFKEGDRQKAHLDVGRILRDRGQSATDVVQHLNEAREQLSDASERLGLCELNLAAARRAKESAAYRPAFDFLSVARELLPGNAWQAHYELAFEVSKLYSSCAYLCGEFAAARACGGELLTHARTTLEKAEVRAMKATQFTFNSRMDEAVDEGIKALELLGIKLTPKPGMATVAGELLRSKLLLGRRKASDLDNAPPVTDPAVKLAMKILGEFIAPSYLTGNDTLFATTVLKQANLSLKHGSGEEAAKAYSSYAVLLAGLGDFKGSYDFGQLALRLSEKYQLMDAKCRILVLYGLFSHSWSQPWSHLSAWFKESVEAGLQSGDFLFMAFACGYVTLWDPQIDLGSAIEEGRKYIALCKQTQYFNALDAAMLSQQLWLNLRGETGDPLSLSDEGFDEAECLRRMTEAKYTSGIAIYHLYKLTAACIREEWTVAWNELLACDKAMKALAGSPYTVEHCIYGFAAAAQIATSRHPDAGAARRRMRKCYKQMRAWARHCPANFEAHAHLMAAELARVEGRVNDAPALYKQAVEAARESGYVRYEAHANEVTARFYLGRGLDREALAYLRDAHYGYARWGATSKVKALELKYPERLLPRSESRTGPLSVTASLSASSSSSTEQVESGLLDLSTVWKATQAISGEVKLERLLEKLIAIVKESAGAQNAALILKEGEEGERFLIQAESVQDSQLQLLHAEPLDDHPRVPVSLIRYVIRSQTSVVLADAAQQGTYTKDPYIQSAKPKSVLAMPIVNQGQLLGVLYLENNLLTDAFTPERLSVLQILAGQAAISLQNARSYEYLAAYNDAYQRFVPLEFIRQLEKRNILDVQLGDHMQRQMTILFSDIRDFTSLSEAMSPEDNFKFINSYLSQMGPLVRRHGGFIDKYIGDAIMALFPNPDGALDAGLAMLEFLKAYNEHRARRVRELLSIGIGINTGSVMLGTVGEAGRMDGTVIGDAVNLASRIEGLTKTYGGALLVSEYTLNQLQEPDRFRTRFVDRVRVKGKSQEVTIHEVLNAHAPEDTERKLRIAPAYEEGWKLVREHSYAEAKTLLQGCLQDSPGDIPARLLLDRCELVLKGGEVWDQERSIGQTP